jgi:DNA-binding NtrC family response regulator
LVTGQCAQRRIEELDPTMMEIFANYSWPGNIRQLRNVVLTSLILGTGPVLSLADVSWLFDELQPLPQQPIEGRLESKAGGTTLGMAEHGWDQASHPNPAFALRHPPSAGSPTDAVSPVGTLTGVGGMGFPNATGRVWEPIPLEDLERRAILETLRQTSGNQTKAAKVLGISDRTLREKMRRYRREECHASARCEV